MLNATNGGDFVYKYLQIHVQYFQRGIIAHKECSEVQKYEFTDDKYYFNNTLDYLKKDLDKVLSLLTRCVGSYIQVSRYEIDNSDRSVENQVFYFEYVNGHFNGTKNGNSWNVVEYSNKEMKLSEVKKTIIDFFSSGLK